MTKVEVNSDSRRSQSALMIFEDPKELQKYNESLRKEPGTSIGFVPTMGALHEGHKSLLRKSINENQFTILSLFVNPTQFEDKTDLESYPQQLKEDLQIAQELGVGAVFVPQAEDIYVDQFSYQLSEKKLSKILCGAHRGQHFDGVLTVVMKLLNITHPHKVYFGEKDYQQYLLVKDMVSAFFLDITVVPCPVVRDKNGLALSSRHSRLSEAGMKKAAFIYQALQLPELDEARQLIEQQGLDVEYLEDFEGRRLVAVYCEGVRLIDNIPLTEITQKTGVN